MEADYRVALWIALSLSGSTLAWFVCKFVSAAKKRRDAKKFSDPRYSIGAAVLNMERAISYDDGENFKFFARYIIRTCLGMPKSYPPNEPSADDVSAKLKEGNVGAAISQKIIAIYSLEELSDAPDEWSGVLDDVRSIIEVFKDFHTNR
jgi:hypothetical protein